jgi:hypothetical protein
MRHSIGMFRYRYVTPHRVGKWYATLDSAQRFACAIGAGFLEQRSGRFVAYRETRLEIARAA